MKYPKGHEFEYRALRPSQIHTDPLYQRPLDNKRVAKIVREFNGDLFNEPKVSWRDGKYWVFNGQHTIAAWRSFHHGEDKLVQCKVFNGMTWIEECNAFMEQNGISKDPTTTEKLRAAYNSRDPDVVAMVEAAALCGFVIDFAKGKTPKRIVAVSSAFRSLKILGQEKFLDMLTAIKECWYGDVDAVSSQIINGMTKFYETYYGNFTRADLVAKLKKTTPAEIIRNGRSYTNRRNTYAQEILKKYNAGRTSRKLPEKL